MKITESTYKEHIDELLETGKREDFKEAIKQTIKFFHHDWLEVRQCDKEEWSQVIEKYVNQPNSQQVKFKTKRCCYNDILAQGGIPYYLNVDKNNVLGYLIVKEDNQYIKYQYNNNRNEKLGDVKGSEAYYYVDGLFKEEYGISIQKAFGETICKEYRQYIPEVFVYTNYTFMNRILDDVSYNDINSAYPYAASQPLPDSRTRVIYFGKDLPQANEEYPFAIYPNSGRLVIYNKVDSRDWKECYQYREHYDNHFDDSAVDDEVWLFKECQYSLKNAMNTLYEKKKEAKESGDEEALKKFKSYMVMFSGCMCPNPENNPRTGENTKMLYLQRAFLLAYHINTMCKEIKKIINAGGLIIQVPTDAIICKNYHNNKPTKAFGGFDVEYSNGKFCGIGTNQYILEEPSGRVKSPQQGNVKPENRIHATTAEEYFDIISHRKNVYIYETYDIRTGKFIKVDDLTNKIQNLNIRRR